MAVGPAAYGGGIYVADKSAWTHVRLLTPQQAAEWEAALLNGQIVTCAVTKLELLYSARDAADYAAILEEQSALREVRMTAGVHDAALAAMGELAEEPGRVHRVSVPDYLVAAAAASVGIGVLHYDQDFDRLDPVFRINSMWIAPRGSL